MFLLSIELEYRSKSNELFVKNFFLILIILIKINNFCYIIHILEPKKSIFKLNS